MQQNSGRIAGLCRNFVAHCRSKVPLRPELQRLRRDWHARRTNVHGSSGRIKSLRLNFEF